MNTIEHDASTQGGMATSRLLPSFKCVVSEGLQLPLDVEIYYVPSPFVGSKAIQM